MKMMIGVETGKNEGREEEMDDLISRQAAINALGERPERPMTWVGGDYELGAQDQYDADLLAIETVPSAQPERLTDDDFETIRIHLSATKESLCNQHRWGEAEDYERLIDRFMSFASAQPERKRGKWIPVTNGRGGHECSLCHSYAPSYQSGDEWLTDYCPNCGADMMDVDDERPD